MVVCCNKMDEKTVNWAESRYSEIKAELIEFLKKVGYNPPTSLSSPFPDGTETTCWRNHPTSDGTRALLSLKP